MPAHYSIKLSDPDNNEELRLDYQMLRKSVLMVRSVDHKLRQQIIKMLIESPRLTVTEIYLKLRLEQSIASQHLAILRRSGIVVTKRTGKFVYYSLNRERLEAVSSMIKELAV